MKTTANSTTIEKSEHEGVTYYTTIRRGVEYCAYFCSVVGKWFVSSHRVALGKFNSGSGKYYENIEDCKAFAALPTMVRIGAL